MAVVIRFRHLLGLEPEIAMVRYLHSSASYCWRSHCRQVKRACISTRNSSHISISSPNDLSIRPAIYIKYFHTRFHRLVVPTTATVSFSQQRLFSSTAKTTPDQQNDVYIKKKKHREHYIPVTRYSVLRHLVMQEGFLRADEKKEFEKFSQALDNAIVNKYHGVLQEVKRLFDPINPDKDTIQTRVWTRQERLDKEYLVLQRLEDILEKANFSELPPSMVNKALEEHSIGDGIKISVNRDKYDILRFWALGRDTPPALQHWYTKFLFWKMSSSQPIHYYKRLVVVIRQKKDSKLVLKAFKDVPVDALEMVLPDGKIKMNMLDKGLLSVSVGIAVVSIVVKVFMVLVEYNFDWSLLVTLLTGLISVRVWTVYKNKRNKYLVKLSRILYYKNLANNRSLLTLLVDRAEDESYKEALLVYFFLLTSRDSLNAFKPSATLRSSELGGITQETLEEKIEDWLFSVTGTNLKFRAEEAIDLLQSFGILSLDSQKLYVHPVETATSLLPLASSPLLSSCSIMERETENEFMDTTLGLNKEEESSAKISKIKFF